MHESSVSRMMSLTPVSAPAPEEMVRQVSSLLLQLANGLSVNGVIPGHLKAMVRQGEDYASFNCTRPGKVTHRTSSGWDAVLLTNPQLLLEVVVISVPQVALAELVDRRLREWRSTVERSAGSGG